MPRTTLSLLLLLSVAATAFQPLQTTPRHRRCATVTQNPAVLQPPTTSAPAAAAGWWARALAATLLCCALAGPAPSRCALAATDIPQLEANVQAEGSPVAREVIALLDKYYLDRSFNGVDLQLARRKLDESGPLTDEQAIDTSTKLVRSLGDRYSRVLSPTQAAKLGKYDVTGVGINLIIADDGAVKVGAVPPESSDAAQLGVAFGDVVLSINGRSSEGMTSFDALEAIQGDGNAVTMRLKPVGGGAERDVVMRKMFQTRNPVSYRLVEGDDGVRTGYIKLSEFNAQCKLRMREAVGELTADGASRLVLDLRGNGGGVLDGALGIAGLFLERPLVLYVTDANGSMQPLYSREALLSASVPLQVWVDQGTASSGEVLGERPSSCAHHAGTPRRHTTPAHHACTPRLHTWRASAVAAATRRGICATHTLSRRPHDVDTRCRRMLSTHALCAHSVSVVGSFVRLAAAALRDTCRASVVGGTTYGKGVIQGVFGLSDGGALIETVASYATPAREEINKRGVTPDVSRTFVSDVLGSGFVDTDVKAAKFALSKEKVCVAPSKE
jgi:C-terminal peptidase prc